MAEEKKGEQKESKGVDWKSSIFFMIFGILLCVGISGLLGLFGMINFGVLGYSWLVLSLVFGALSGFLYSIAPKESRGIVFLIIIIIAFFLLFITGALQTGKLKEPINQGWNFVKSLPRGVGNIFGCFSPNSTACLTETGTQTNNGSQGTGPIKSATFSGNNTIINNQIDILASITFNNPD